MFDEGSFLLCERSEIAIMKILFYAKTLKKIDYGFFLRVCAITFASVCFLNVSNVSARIEKIEGMAVENGFQVGPSQIREEAYPGDVIKREIWVDNRLGKEQEFLVTVEAFQGSADGSVSDGGPQGGIRTEHSAESWINKELARFRIAQGERQFFNIEIAVPDDAETGEYYANVSVSALPDDAQSELDTRIPRDIKVADRAGVNIAIGVKGFAKKMGALSSFRMDKRWYQNLDARSWRNEYPVSFLVEFENSGARRLRPYGTIEIANIFGWKVGSVPVEPFNVLRDSTRGMVYNWERDWFLGGYYTATLELQRGDGGDGVDTAAVSFWVFPWKEILVAGMAWVLYKRTPVFFKNKRQNDAEKNVARCLVPVAPRKKACLDIQVVIHDPMRSAEDKSE